MLLLLWLSVVITFSEKNTGLYGLIRFFLSHIIHAEIVHCSWDHMTFIYTYQPGMILLPPSQGTFGNIWRRFCPLLGISHWCHSAFYSAQDSPPPHRGVQRVSNAPCFRGCTKLEMPWKIWDLWEAYPWGVKVFSVKVYNLAWLN